MPFVKGQSGNPGGKPKGLARRVRERTRDGEAIVDFMLKVFRGRAGKKFGSKDRLTAAIWLAERGWGKAPQALTGEDGQGPVKIIVERRYVGADGAD